MGRCKVNWFKKRKQPEFDIVTNDVPLTTVARWYLYDTDLVENVNDLADSIGLTRISQEGEAKEVEDSDRRMQNAAALFPFLESMADLSARVMTAIHFDDVIEDNPDIDEDDEELVALLSSMQNIYKAVALSTLVGTFSGALELGIIETSTISSDTYLLERDEDE